MSLPATRGRASHTQSRGRGGNRGRGRGGLSNASASLAVASQTSTPMDSGIATPVEEETATVVRKKFREFEGLSDELLRNLPFERCTEVQEATLPTILAQHDLLAQAKTGTGKTLAFLVPSIQRLLSLQKAPAQGFTSILVLSPTRELALQIGEAAEGLLGGQGGKYGVKCVVGGTNMDRDVRDLKTQRADIVVATPGRLVDLLQNGGIKPRFSQLILDEADRLLDAGFRRELLQILESLPDRNQVARQTLLFSATIPKEVHTIASLALSPAHKFITTLTEEDVNVHEHVMQESLIVPGGDILPATLEVLLREEEKGKSGGGFKVMVFLPTARAAGLFHDLFTALPISFPVWEIHSRMSQSKRVKATDSFRAAERGVLFSSDVTARGIDVKGVTAVVQVGLPSSAEQYVHRLGRTARAGASGHGVIVLAEYEAFFLRNREMQTFNLHSYASTVIAERSRVMIDAGLQNVSDESKGQAYQAWIGYYNSNLRALKWSQADLVRNANDYAKTALHYQGAGSQDWKPPGLFAKTVGKMGLKGVPGLNIVKETPTPGQGGGRGGRQGGGQRLPAANPQLGKREREIDTSAASQRPIGGEVRGAPRGRARGGGGGRGGRGSRGGGSARGAFSGQN
ncbi:hypothetical protein P7C73_g113, partial [Tremellales sp. Uapishka_1]